VSSEIDAVSAGSAKDVWAFGSIWPHTHTLIEHFNGKAWRVVPSLHVAGTKLMGCRCGGASDRLGGRVAGSEKEEQPSAYRALERLFVEARTEPEPERPEDELLAISARSARDIWAVGDHRAGHHTRTLALHWDGRGWKQVASPSPTATDSSLWGVTAIGAKDAWAVGVSGMRPLAEHWNGRAWRVVPVRPPAGSTESFLRAVSASSSTDVWAAGQDGYKPKALVEHWDGHAWTSAPTAAVSSHILSGIAGVSASDVWAVGTNAPTGLR
jgi:hypothetical protein